MMDELGGMLLLSKEEAVRGRQQQAGTQQALSQPPPGQRGSLTGGSGQAGWASVRVPAPSARGGHIRSNIRI